MSLACKRLSSLAVGSFAACALFASNAFSAPAVGAASVSQTLLDYGQVDSISSDRSVVVVAGQSIALAGASSLEPGDLAQVALLTSHGGSQLSILRVNGT